MGKKPDFLAVVSVAAAVAYTVLTVVSVVTDRGMYDIASNLVVAVIFLALGLFHLTKTVPCTARDESPSEDGL